MAHSGDTRAKIIQFLADTPFVNHACKKYGITRGTFYRWKKDNKEFRLEVDKVMLEGRENINEICDMMLLKKIREGDMGAIRQWQSHNNPTYVAKRPMPPPPSIGEQERKILIDAMHTIKSTRPLTKEAQANIERALRMAGFIDEEGQMTDRFRDEFGSLIAEQDELENERKKIYRNPSG